MNQWQNWSSSSLKKIQKKKNTSMMNVLHEKLQQIQIIVREYSLTIDEFFSEGKSHYQSIYIHTFLFFIRIRDYYQSNPEKKEEMAHQPTGKVPKECSISNVNFNNQKVYASLMCAYSFFMIKMIWCLPRLPIKSSENNANHGNFGRGKKRKECTNSI